MKSYIEAQEVIKLVDEFDKFICSATREATDENIAIYEHWLDCKNGIRDLALAAVLTYEIISCNSGIKEFADKVKEEMPLDICSGNEAIEVIDEILKEMEIQ